MKAYLSLVFCLLSAFAWSQTTQITGRVTKDTSTTGLAGVSVSVKGTKVATSTNNEGRYSIGVPQGSNTLVFSSVGLRPQEVNIAGRTTLDVSLTEEAAAMSDVVVVGYTTVRRR
ncbi:MAG: carboxypeptidase-like regulatory domain-containing protein, partial [Chitinophagaceae bacterium]|nr:carboxypeptidase-like regulatory domain-containing protein [Chitinophagaceae bacterium]